MKLIKGLIFGVDLFNGLVWYVVLTLTFLLLGHHVPQGFAHLHIPFTSFNMPLPRQLIVVGIAAVASILPDLDMVPYMRVRKNKMLMLDALGGVCCAPCLFLGWWLHSPAFLLLGAAGAFGVTAAIFAKDRVRARASHWPVWHHPIPVLAIVAGLAWAFSRDFDPLHLWYYDLLVVPLVGAHFLHDGIQPQGFPFLSPFTDRHYEWQVFSFERVPSSLVREHYRQQAARANSQTSKQDAERRTDKITSKRIGLFLLAAMAATLLLLWLSFPGAHLHGARHFFI